MEKLLEGFKYLVLYFLFLFTIYYIARLFSAGYYKTKEKFLEKLFSRNGRKEGLSDGKKEKRRRE